MIAIRAMTAEDWPAVQAIYAEGIAAGQATFEEEPPNWSRFDTAKLSGHRHVAVEDEHVIGWAAVAPVSARLVYSGVVEHSVYVAKAARGRGVGRLLLPALIAATEQDGIWTIQSSVFPENTASLALHAAHGFRQLGRRERIALMTYGPHAGQWRATPSASNDAAPLQDAEALLSNPHKHERTHRSCLRPMRTRPELIVSGLLPKGAEEPADRRGSVKVETHVLNQDGRIAA